MCHETLRDPQFYRLLERIDEEQAHEVQWRGCSCCGGVLHSARYPRKPRGIPRGLRAAEPGWWRRSFCCAQCRRRHTPGSVLYLGRRVYVGAMVLLGSALRGSVSGRGLRHLCGVLEVPRATLQRWCRWWRETFVATRLWQGLRGGFVPPIAAPLPGGWLDRIEAPDERTRVVRALRLLVPLSTVGEGRAVGAWAPQSLEIANGARRS